MPEVKPQSGGRVTHRTLGPGSTTRIERGGRWVWVAFDSSPTLPFRVRATELTAHDNGTPPPDEPPAPPAAMAQPRDEPAEEPAAAEPPPPEPTAEPAQPTPDASSDDPDTATASTVQAELGEPGYRAAILLEALRLGAVPHGMVARYTVGRERELPAILSALDARPGPGGRLRVAVGDYGTGKTHLLECVREQALQRGYAVASVTLDGAEVTASHPRRIYRGLVRGLALPQSPGQRGLAPLFEALLADGYVPRRAKDPKAHRYLDHAILYYAGLAGQPALRELLLEWIEGQPGEWSEPLNKLLHRCLPGPRLLALPDYRTFGSVYAYLLGGIACLCKTAGARGLLMLVDEAEFYAALRAEDRAFAETVFACYTLAALPPELTLQGEDAIKKGGQAIHRQVPLRHSPTQPLACVFFLTPDQAGLEMLGRWVRLDRHVVELSALQPAAYQTLVDRVDAIYRTAHPSFAVPPGLSRPMGEMLHAAVASGLIANPRAALKLVVELLDICRLTPHHVEAALGDLARCFDDV